MYTNTDIQLKIQSRALSFPILFKWSVLNQTVHELAPHNKVEGSWPERIDGYLADKHPESQSWFVRDVIPNFFRNIIYYCLVGITFVLWYLLWSTDEPPGKYTVRHGDGIRHIMASGSGENTGRSCIVWSNPAQLNHSHLSSSHTTQCLTHPHHQPAALPPLPNKHEMYKMT